MSAEVGEEWVILLLLRIGGQERLHVECVLLHGQQTVQDVDRERLQDIELSHARIVSHRSFEVLLDQAIGRVNVLLSCP